MEKTRIMAFGTFDVLHPGHLNFFKQARKLAKNPYLIVSVARDVNVKRIKNQKPLYNEHQRQAEVKKSGLVDKVVLGGLKKHLPHIIRAKPKIIALGYDQKQYVAGLAKSLADKGLKVVIRRLRPHKASIYKSSLFKAVST